MCLGLMPFAPAREMSPLHPSCMHSPSSNTAKQCRSLFSNARLSVALLSDWWHGAY